MIEFQEWMFFLIIRRLLLAGPKLKSWILLSCAEFMLQGRLVFGDTWHVNGMSEKNDTMTRSVWVWGRMLRPIVHESGGFP